MKIAHSVPALQSRTVDKFPTIPGRAGAAFCGTPSSGHQGCSSLECHEDIAQRSRLATNIATLAAFILIAGIIILTAPLIVFPLTRGMP
jgi:hypothetical protein